MGRAPAGRASRAGVHPLHAHVLGRPHTPEAEITAGAEAFGELGITHVLTMPAHGDLSDWLRSVEELWRILSPYRDVSPAS